MNESRRIIGRLKKEGWEQVSQKGSHVTLKREGVEHLITVPHPRKDLPKGLKRAIGKAAGWC